MDRIVIEDLRLRTVIGVHEWERKTLQEVRISLALDVDLARAAETDDLNDSVDYRALAKAVIGHVESSSYELLERLAGSVAELALGHSPRIEAVTVRADKPGALRFARTVAVEVRRERAPREP